MPEINSTGAAERLMAYRTNQPGLCLYYNWQAIGQGAHYLTGGAANAFATWQAIPDDLKHPGDRNVPKDFPAFFGIRPSTGDMQGDVITSFGDGTFAATDYPQGHLGRPTLAQRALEIGRVYLGWAEGMGGYKLTTTVTADSGITPITEKKRRAHMDRILKGSGPECWQLLPRIVNGVQTTTKSQISATELTAMQEAGYVIHQVPDAYLSEFATL